MAPVAQPSSFFTALITMRPAWATASDDGDDAPGPSHRPRAPDDPSARERDAKRARHDAAKAPQSNNRRAKTQRKGGRARPRAPASKHNAQKLYRYGNYDRYYGYRVGATLEDPRLRAFAPEWFTNKAACDVGCNEGLLSLTIATSYEPREMVCIDIDDALVRQAQKKLQELRVHSARQAASAERGGAVGTLANRGRALGGVEFRCANAVEYNFGVERFDIILMMSVTKWIHLNWGDEGLKRVFVNAYAALAPGGALIIEPQPWRSYKQAFRKNKHDVPAEWKSHYGSIKLKPDMFESYLKSVVGFRTIQRLALEPTRRRAANDDANTNEDTNADATPPSAVAFNRDILRCIK